MDEIEVEGMMLNPRELVLKRANDANPPHPKQHFVYLLRSPDSRIFKVGECQGSVFERARHESNHLGKFVPIYFEEREKKGYAAASEQAILDDMAYCVIPPDTWCSKREYFAPEPELAKQIREDPKRFFTGILEKHGPNGPATVLAALLSNVLQFTKAYIYNQKGARKVFDDFCAGLGVMVEEHLIYDDPGKPSAKRKDKNGMAFNINWKLKRVGNVLSPALLKELRTICTRNNWGHILKVFRSKKNAKTLTFTSNDLFRKFAKVIPNIIQA
jgi:hypothetical protein